MKLVTFTRAAQKTLRSLPPQIADRILNKINRYADTSEGDVKALKGQDAYRLRVGDYRVIFTDAFQIIAVIKIGHRREIYE